MDAPSLQRLDTQGNPPRKADDGPRPGIRNLLILMVVNGILIGTLAIYLFSFSPQHHNSVTAFFGREPANPAVVPEGKLAVSPQDVSSLFTQHLTAIGILLAVTSLIVLAMQYYAQAEESKRNKNVETVMEHTATLIANMSNVMSATARSLEATNDLRREMETSKAEKQEARDRLREAGTFLKEHSILQSNFRNQIRAEFSRLNQFAPKVPPGEHPVEYRVLTALHTGANLLQSREAIDALEKDDELIHKASQDLWARSLYYRGHFSLRVGAYARASEYFNKALSLHPGNDSYHLYQLISRLLDARQRRAFEQEEAILKGFQEFWKEKTVGHFPLELRGVPEEIFWEHFGHYYGALLVEGLDAEAGLQHVPLEARRARILQGLAVVEKAGQLSPKPSGAFDAVKFEVGLRLAQLGDQSRLMSENDLTNAIDKCRRQARATDSREKIVYTTRIARFYGRLAAAQQDKEAIAASSSEMARWKEDALGLLKEFDADWDKEERVFSVFTNAYQRPEAIIAAINGDVTIEKYRSEREQALSAAP